MQQFRVGTCSWSYQDWAGVFYPKGTAPSGYLIFLITAFSGCAREEKPMPAPQETEPWVIRTDFSDGNQWHKVRELISAAQEESGFEFFAHVKFVSLENYRDKDVRDLVVSLPDNYPFHFCFVVDRECIVNQDHRVLVVGFYPSDLQSYRRPPRETPTREIKTFRALPSQIQSIENNLSIANMDFEEFASKADKDGVFRGFRR
jgi:hypothetical protein